MPKAGSENLHIGQHGFGKPALVGSVPSKGIEPGDLINIKYKFKYLIIK